MIGQDARQGAGMERTELPPALILARYGRWVHCGRNKGMCNAIQFDRPITSSPRFAEAYTRHSLGVVGLSFCAEGSGWTRNQIMCT